MTMRYSKIVVIHSQRKLKLSMSITTHMKFRIALFLLSVLMFLATCIFLVSTVHAQGMPQRAACGVVVQHTQNSPCLTQRRARKLLQWQGGAFTKSPVVAVPLRWTLYSHCQGNGSMRLTISDLQMPIESEVVHCGQYHEEHFYPLEDRVFFSANKNFSVQVWTP